MKHEHRDRATKPDRTTDPMFSRRSALSSSGLVLLGALAGPALGQTEGREAGGKGPATQVPKEGRMELPKALMERLQNAGSEAGGPRGISERMASLRQMGFENLRTQLRISDQEWPVVKPRLQAVYDLVRPVVTVQAGTDAQPGTELEQRRSELQKLAREDKPDMGQIKAKLMAYRAAKEKANQELSKARQNLRQIMDLRQEAVLVVNGLLD